jgi:polyisoprenoid-binding protein YceI
MSTLETLLRDPAIAGVWNLVPDRSSVRFKNKTMWGLMSVKGTFDDVSGDGQITANGAVFGKLDIRAASLHTGIGKRDEHLRSADFFDVERYPEISVVVTAVQPTGTDTANLGANLTIKGTTLPLPLQAKVTALGDGTIAISASTTVDRAKWDVTGNQLGMVGMTTTLFADTVFARAQ